ncbi:MFS multidrug transporter-like protein [Macroventuria anomochaeta]|uniref:MFS multidrug transporter-like protein n=1 Tax=Macroventuria anomochaeta TaxID=301207 RepID=A0ACB6RMR5_9PLEO|nr:MFS multidrug transporter-like protein [Macroventuria anomochaeta]KAF2623216.1 MFS multidrug transporter-like protein [Macroventuria anomochaeta]
MGTASKEVIRQGHVDNEKGVTDAEKSDPKQSQSQSKHITDSPEAAWDEAFLVTFAADDAENPLNWTTKLKWGVTAAVSGTGFVRIMVSTMMAPAINTIASELHMSTTESFMALSVYLLATAFGPLIIGPLSEVYGRRRVFHVTNVWFLLWNFVCGFANSKGLLIAARLLAGFGASAAYSLAYGVLGDVWPAEQRGRSVSLYLLIPLTGSAVGPIVSGFIVEYSTWRWMFWSTTILQVILEGTSLLVFYESYAPFLLRKRAEKLRKETGDSRYHAAIEMRESGRSTMWKLRRSLSRPLRLLAFHPIIQIQAILAGINYGLLYFALASFSALHVSAYGESVAISGLHYIAICTGTISGAQLCGPLMDYVYKRLTSHSGDGRVPELRIPLLLPGVFFTPIGFLLYGWAAQYRLFWLVVDIGAALLSLGMQIFDTTLHAYVMDAYPEHISSASAATQVLRSLLAFAFPLFSDKLYDTLGYGWGNSLMAFLSIGIALPATGILWRWGAKLRAKRESSY